jgi:tetratricopeptide (TPR) repeat protein
MTIKTITLITILFLFSNCKTDDCIVNNLIPEYGRQKKCQDLIDTDNKFLETCDANFENRKEASEYHIQRGWDFFYKNQLDTSMMRFNQAWLLDSTNADIYWGFGNILGRQQKFKESLTYFEKSVAINGKNSKVWQCYATSYGQLYFQTKDISLLYKAIDNLMKSISLDPTNGEAYGQLTACYTSFTQQDSAKKYLEITDRLDPKAINPEVRRILNEKKNGL